MCKEISGDDIKIIKHAAKSILFNQGQMWKNTKNNNNEKPLHGITMGSNHGPEICELVGLYLLKGGESILNKENVGIYRDDGLIAISNKTSGNTMEKLKKNLHEYVKTIGLKIKIENASHIINFLRRESQHN